MSFLMFILQFLCKKIPLQVKNVMFTLAEADGRLLDIKTDLYNSICEKCSICVKINTYMTTQRMPLSTSCMLHFNFLCTIFKQTWKE